MTTTTETTTVVHPHIGARVRVEPAGGRNTDEDRFAYLATVVDSHPAAGDATACIDLEVAALLDEDGEAITSGCPFVWSLYDSEQAAGTRVVL